MQFFFPTGLDMCEQFMDVNDMIRDEDLIVHKVHPHGNGLDHRFYATSSARNIQQYVSSMVPSVVSKRPSARELNLLKRKAKINSKDLTKGWTEDGDTEMSSAQSTTPKGHSSDSLNFNKVLEYLVIRVFEFMEWNHQLAPGLTVGYPT